ncbi:MAG TPA: hypothetical protein VKG82_00460 [Solirubrobacteraceae bacterium]|nr:hypothetical protein [Solirubrobacteraceae bacterium]
MLYRPLVLVSGLTLGDYLLWRWSLNGNHEALALVSGVTLPPLLLALVWLLAKSAMRALVLRASRRTDGAALAGGARRRRRGPRDAPHTGEPPAPSPAGTAERDSGRLAA